MPQLDSIVLSDGQTTPVARTFSPKRILDGKGLLRENAAASIETAPTITLAKGKDSPVVERTKCTIAVPYVNAALETKIARFNCEFIVPLDAPPQIRKDLLAYTKNLAAHATVLKMVVDSEGIW